MFLITATSEETTIANDGVAQLNLPRPQSPAATCRNPDTRRAAIGCGAIAKPHVVLDLHFKLELLGCGGWGQPKEVTFGMKKLLLISAGALALAAAVPTFVYVARHAARYFDTNTLATKPPSPCAGDPDCVDLTPDPAGICTQYPEACRH
ncbi:hypothetical protein GCM10007857_63580 [Bradyrhizobium iriomotense]|uniref:Kazal-like domain-containing protein n=1 Tax=Bradyrhizobium iriomotense TaxID=441950 RepID=A0ABQ6B8B6_9BRAD|nr:hypothetical protein GCM10007857_63580 [Bradyrhizobium iriomotense]